MLKPEDMDRSANPVATQVRYSDRVRGIRADCLPPEILELAIYGEPLPPPPEVVDEISRLFTQQPRAE